ncbi:MAG: DUF3368 domain-containing protein [Candidatus Tectimicrobiota bacterium]|nr:MAG: DUF3368 domain-containing protein [Candidatus Tectomicrobia bacterium]
MPGVVVNASTLINLASIGRLELLREFHGKITVPPAVWQEVVVEGQGRPGAVEVEKAREASWLEVLTPQNQDLVKILRRDLDAGEAEAIALAVEQEADLIFLDEADARRVAEIYGLPRTGVIGVLIRAKQEGKISSLKQELDRLREEAGFWIHEQLYRQVLEEAGEL